jgi:septal ring factor EnvC (AmiA/AmiB activator)
VGEAGQYVGSAHYYQPAPPPVPVAAPRALAVELPTVITLAAAVGLATALLTYQSPSQQANRQQQQQIQQLSRQLQALEAQKQGLEQQTGQQATLINHVKASVCQ